MKFPVIFPDGADFRIGKGKVVRKGSDLSIIAVGLMVSEALKAAEALAKKGISARVVNMSTFKPIDEELIEECARQTGAIVTAEEHSVIGGLGSAVCEVTAARCPVPVKMVGIKDRFGMSGKSEELLACYGLQSRGHNQGGRGSPEEKIRPGCRERARQESLQKASQIMETLALAAISLTIALSILLKKKRPPALLSLRCCAWPFSFINGRLSPWALPGTSTGRGSRSSACFSSAPPWPISPAAP